MFLIDLFFSFSTAAILLSLWTHWIIWAVMFLPPKIYRVERLHMGGLGMALPGMLFIVEGQPESTLHHEQTHTLQMRRYSPIGVALFLGWHYGSGFLWQKVRGEQLNFWSLWQSNPLEMEANDKMYTGVSPLKIEASAMVHFIGSTLFLFGLTWWLIG